MTILRQFLAIALVSSISSLTPILATADDVYWIGGTATWNSDSNWDVGGANAIPDVGFNDTALIGNDGTALLTALAQNAIGQLNLGAESNAGTGIYGSGSLQIQTGGVLNVQNNGTTSGSATIGRVGANGAPLGSSMADSQQGALSIQGNGALSVDNRFFLERRVQANAMLTLQDTASVTVGGDSDMRGTARIIGPGVTFNSNTMQWAGQLLYIPEITSATHSIMSVTGAATLNSGATIAPEFSSPQLGGEVYTLVDASSINDLGIVLDESNAGLTQGQKLRTFVDGSGATEQLKLAVDNVLTLTANRRTGAISVSNTHAAGISIKGYSVQSPAGYLNQTNGVWNSFDDMGTDGGNWQEANPTSNALSELNLTNSHMFDGGTNTSFGSPYELPAFAVGDDLTFTYQTASGNTVEGIVEYTGGFNNLVLRVDPATGNAVITNESQFAAEINGYSIRSGDGTPGSGSLLTTWDSLDKQTIGTWQEANPTSEGLNELNLDGALTLNTGQSIALDGLWDTAGSQDLAFDFALVGGTGSIDGVILYEAASPGIPGDFNGDDAVNGADFLNWQRGNTTPPLDPQLLADWQNNYGIGSPVSGGVAGAVPEPASALLLFTASLAMCPLRRRR